MIHASGLIKSFGSPPLQVIKNIDLDINDGEFIAITGRSGSGKSTLLYILSTLDHPTSGFVEVDGEKVYSLSEERVHRLRNISIGFVFQFHYLLPELTALENILMPARKAKRELERKDYGLELLDKFGIVNKADRYPSQLSGGEQQRVAIARALVMKPKYLFADEPTGNLDSANSDVVMSIFKDVNKRDGMTIVYVTHDKGFASQAQRQITLVDGQISSD